MFITLEGPEGAGKSTVAKGLAEALTQEGHTVCRTREPGSGDIGSKIRTLLLNTDGTSPKCELFLFLADRAQHVETVVKPALAAGQIVLCDRFADSTVVYQGYARGFDKDLLRQWNDFATGSLRPDITLLLDLPAEEGVARVRVKDRLDSEPLEFHEKVRNGFLAEAKLDSTRWVVIDARNDPDTVLSHCLADVVTKLGELRNTATR